MCNWPCINSITGQENASVIELHTKFLWSSYNCIIHPLHFRLESANDHIVQTIKMLEALPFPQHLKQVPEIAGGHHEKMDGKGYPKRLKRADMSLPARMMAIADIFEALTAADRPYKKGKLLSEAVKILAFMVKDQHIDADLFELFLSSGIYLDYAQRFMIPAQIDDVNVSDVLQSIKPSSHIGAYAT